MGLLDTPECVLMMATGDLYNPRYGLQRGDDRGAWTTMPCSMPQPFLCEFAPDSNNQTAPFSHFPNVTEELAAYHSGRIDPCDSSPNPC